VVPPVALVPPLALLEVVPPVALVPPFADAPPALVVPPLALLDVVPPVALVPPLALLEVVPPVALVPPLVLLDVVPPNAAKVLPPTLTPPTLEPPPKLDTTPPCEEAALFAVEPPSWLCAPPNVTLAGLPPELLGSGSELLPLHPAAQISSGNKFNADLRLMGLSKVVQTAVLFLPASGNGFNLSDF
jgi:hypothetical protein